MSTTVARVVSYVWMKYPMTPRYSRDWLSPPITLPRPMSHRDPGLRPSLGTLAAVTL